MSVTLLDINVERHDAVRMWASRSEEVAFLVIDTEETQCEIRMDRTAVEAVRDHLSSVLAGLDRVAAEDAAYVTAREVEQRVVDEAGRALDLAVAAEAAGADDVARSLRAAADEARGKAAAVDAAVAVFEEAAAEADHAAQRVDYFISKAHARLRGDDQPAGLTA